jgi:hypothetical protein
MIKTSVRMTERSPIKEAEESKQLITTAKVRIAKLNETISTWESYKKNSSVITNNFREYIQNLPECIKSEIDFSAISQLLGLDLVI